MANTTLKTRIALKVDTAEKWASSSLVLMKGEIGIESDTNKFKFGDGVKTYSQLEYASAKPCELSEQDPSVSDTGGPESSSVPLGYVQERSHPENPALRLPAHVR